MPQMGILPGAGAQIKIMSRCQAKFLTYYCLSVILLLKVKE